MLTCTLQSTRLQSNKVRTKSSLVTLSWAPVAKKWTLRKPPPPPITGPELFGEALQWVLQLGCPGTLLELNNSPDSPGPSVRSSSSQLFGNNVHVCEAPAHSPRLAAPLVTDSYLHCPQQRSQNGAQRPQSRADEENARCRAMWPPLRAPQPKWLRHLTRVGFQGQGGAQSDGQIDQWPRQPKAGSSVRADGKAVHNDGTLQRWI